MPFPLISLPSMVDKKTPEDRLSEIDLLFCLKQMVQNERELEDIEQWWRRLFGVGDK